MKGIKHLPPNLDDLKFNTRYGKILASYTIHARNASLIRQSKSLGRMGMILESLHQFKALQACSRWPMYFNDDVEVVVHMKEDALIHTLNISNVLKSVNRGEMVTSRCGVNHGGVDAKLMFASGTRATDFFSVPYEEFLLFDSSLHWASRFRSEQLYKVVYKKHNFILNMTEAIILTTMKIKGKSRAIASQPLLPAQCRISPITRKYDKHCAFNGSLDVMSYDSTCWTNDKDNLTNTAEKGKPRETNKHRSAYICITGQLSRLELHNKINQLFSPLHALGYSLYIGLALSEGVPNFSNNNSGAKLALKKSISDVISELSSVKGVKEVRHYPPRFDQLKFNSNYEKLLGTDVYLTDNDTVILDTYITNQAELAFNNARQYKTLQYCNNQRNIESETDFIVRVRDDALMFRLDLRQILELVYNGAVVTSKCDQWKGINDKMAFAPSSRASNFFNVPYEEYLTFDVSPLNITALNAEQFYNIAYKKHGFRLVSSDAIVVTKAATRFDSNVAGGINCTVRGKDFGLNVTKFCPYGSLKRLSYKSLCWQ